MKKAKPAASWHAFFYGSDVFKSITNLSGGEWTRLRFAILMHKRPNLLILDEPTNHLDIDSREALEEALEEFPGTVLAVSHDRYFINRCFGKLWHIDGGRFSSFSGNYEYYKEKLAEHAEAAQRQEATQPESSGRHRQAPLCKRAGRSIPIRPSQSEPQAASGGFVGAGHCRSGSTACSYRC